MTIEEMRARKQELGYTNQMISDMTGIPLSTVQKVFAGSTTAPRRSTIEALEKLLRPPFNYASAVSEDLTLGESAVPYGSPAADGTSARKEDSMHGPGSYTLDDYLALPEDQRVELIDGFFYDMAAPTTIHQSIAGYLYKKFLDHVLEHKGPCYPFISPVDVQLDCDDKTVVQPDVMIVCDRDKYRNGRIFGAPDLIVEVLSPSTRKKDMQLKMSKYSNACVREYWMADPAKKMIVQYDLENLEFPVVYSFAQVIPVLIWDSACRIDLKEMDNSISFLWEK